MNTKFKAVFCLLCSVVLFISCEIDENATTERVDKLEINKSTTEVKFDLYVKLQDRYGNAVSAETLPGYAATNLETGEIYYDSRYEVGLLESLPIGTYRVDAYDGYFDGASSAIIEISTENETPEGWIEVTLRYWSE